jgi:hypothetical protein
MVSQLTGRIRSNGGLLGSKRVQIALLLAAVVLTAGCMGGGGGGGDGAVDSVPADVNGVMYLDGSIATDRATTELMNGLIEMSDQQMAPGDPSNWDEVLEEVESESDISIEDFDSATFFFRGGTEIDTGDVGEEYAGMIVESDWAWEDIVAAADGGMGDVEEQTYNGVTVYVDSAEGEQGWVADFGDGTFAFGTENAVKDVIDTREGDADSFGGDLRDAYDSAGDGLMKVAVDLSEESIGANDPTTPEVSVMTMSYSSSGSEMQFSAQMTVPSEEDAEEFANTLSFGLNAMTQEDPELSALAENLEIDNDGDRITMEYSITTDELLDQLEDLDSGMAPVNVPAQQSVVAG